MTEPTQTGIHSCQPGRTRPPMFSRRDRWALCLLALALGSLGQAGCRGGSSEEKGKEGDSKAGGTPAGVTETAVVVTPAALRSMSASISITGALTAEKDVVVGTKNPGKVVDVRLREGDRVSVNQIVAVMDTSDLNIQMRQQQSNLASAVT